MTEEKLPKVYTSYFGRLAKIDREKYCPINIAGKQPNGVALPTCDAFVPPKKLVFDYKDGRVSWATYVHDYHENRLDLCDARKVLADLLAIAAGRIPVLICYEKPEDNCHRHLAGWWLMSEGVAGVEELQLCPTT